MLGKIFYWVVNMSILGTMMGGILLLLRKVKKLPPLLSYILWSIPLIRFWIPFGIASPYSLMNLLSEYMMRTIVIHQSIRDIPDITMMNTIMAADSYDPFSYKAYWMEISFAVFAGIWITVFMMAVIIVCIFYYLAKREIDDAIYVEDNIYQSEKITAPAVYGLRRPKIILPCGISQEHLPYILSHERVHIKRRDNIFRAAGIITACLHWFNPLMWIFLKSFLEDMEYACDAQVLKGYDAAQQKGYALALVDTVAAKSVFTSAFGGAKVKNRIEKILTYKRLTMVSTIFFGTFAAVLVWVLLANAAG